MSNRILAATFAAAAALVLTTGGRAEAQWLGGAPVGGTRTYAGVGGTTALTPGYAASTVTYASHYGPPVTLSSGVSGYTPPYSYYAAIPPAPARVYVDYGDSGFNFYGRPYGHPYDRWSWESLASGQGLLNRYYYPPVR